MALPLVSAAIDSASAQGRPTLPAIRSIGVPTATLDSVTRESYVRAFADGSILLAEGGTGSLYLVDASLKARRPVLDSTGKRELHGTYVGFFPYRGDSTLTLRTGNTIPVILDRTGRVGRIVSEWRILTGIPSTNFTTASDAQGRIYHRRTTRSGDKPVNHADTATLVRRGPETTEDSIIALLLTVTGYDVNPRKPVIYRPSYSPADSWAMLSDGTIALVRVSDYHVDWIGPDDIRRTTPPTAWNWQVLDMEARRAVADSQAAALAIEGSPARQPLVVFNSAPTTYSAVPASSLRDSVPPFRATAAKGDADGRLWVREAALRGGRLVDTGVYHVIDRSGRIIDRVEVPEGHEIVAFAPGGIVYTAGPTTSPVMQVHRFRYR